MEFAPRELKQIERLRKQERQWRRNRWFMLVGGIIIGVEFVISLVLLCHQLFLALNVSDFSAAGGFLFSVTILMIALNWPMCLVAFCISGWCIITAIQDWHGNTNRVLLLKLLDARQSQSPNPAKIA